MYRRFREFLWLEEQLGNNHPGVIVPPTPEKNAIGRSRANRNTQLLNIPTIPGRFEEDFVENRRVLLERMLRKIVQHPILQADADLKLFLESESFDGDVRCSDTCENSLTLVLGPGEEGKAIVHVQVGWCGDKRHHL